MGKISAKVPAGGASLAAQKRVSESNAKEVAQSESIQKSAQSPHKISAYENHQGSARFRSLSETSPKNFAAFLINSKSSLSGEEGAMKLMRAMAGLGTDEDAIFSLLNHASPSERLDIKNAFRQLYKTTLEERLAKDLSGVTLQRALGALRGDDTALSDKSARGAYQPVGVYAPTMRGALLNVASFLSSSWLTKGLVQNQVKKELQFEAFKAIDLGAYEKMAEPALSAKPAGRATPLESLVNDNPVDGAKLSVSALHQAYKSGITTPLEVAERFLKNVAQDKTNSFVHVDEKALLDAAEASTERYRKGTALGPLDGITISVKDQIDVAGMPSTVGTSFLGKEAAKEDAEVIKNLRAQGVLIVGKTVMNELGFGANGINPHHGVVKNPYDLNKSAGGSSSGSAASVAAALVVASIGSDSGGSTRVPASLNGLYGLKPTWGTLSNKGNYALTPSTMQAGPMTNNTEDSAMLFAAMAGGVDLAGFGERDLSGISVGVYRDYANHADPEIVDAMKKFEDELRARGAKIKEIRIDDLNLAPTAQLINFGIEASRTQREHLQAGQSYGPDTQVNLDVAESLDESLLAQAQRSRSAISESMNQAMKDVDMVLTPMTAMTAPTLTPSVNAESNVQEAEALLRFAVVPSLTGLPALSLPAGLDQSGMPIGMQLIGKAHDEKTLLRAAKALEKSPRESTPATT